MTRLLAARLLLSSWAVLVAAGCGSPPGFSIDRQLAAEAGLDRAAAESVDRLLTDSFGTPDDPIVPAALAGVIDVERVADAAGPVESHTEGVTTGLYRRHCSRCHGLTGDGRGAAALYQSPYPRDFRAGAFKFKSTERGAPPTDADLHATLTRGLAGAAMPSFQLLKEDELAALVDYTKYLAVRGEVERTLVQELADSDPEDMEEFADGEAPWVALLVQETIVQVAERWRSAGARVVAADEAENLDSPDLIARGKELFHDEKLAGCVKCHGEGGRGSGVQQELDLWNGRRRDFLAKNDALAASLGTLVDRLASTPKSSREQLADRIARARADLGERRSVGASLLPPQPTRSRVLAGGRLRSSGEADDLFRILHEGIAGSPMPAAGEALTNEQIWSLVAYVQSIAMPTGGEQP